MKAVVTKYLGDKFEWFVFDVVELGKEVKTKDAIQYRFPTRFLYYPLRITRTEEGNTLIRLLVISPELLNLPNSVHLLHKPIRISPKELRSLGNKDFSDLLKGRNCMLYESGSSKDAFQVSRKTSSQHVNSSEEKGSELFKASNKMDF